MFLPYGEGEYEKSKNEKVVFLALGEKGKEGEFFII